MSCQFFSVILVLLVFTAAEHKHRVHISSPLVQNAHQPPKHFRIQPKVSHAAIKMTNAANQQSFWDSEDSVS